MQEFWGKVSKTQVRISIIPYYLTAPWAPKSNLLPKHIFYMSRPWKRFAFEWGFGSVVVWDSQEVMGGVGGREPGAHGRGNFAKLSPRTPSSAPTHGRPIRAPLLSPDLYLCFEAQNHIYIYIFFFSLNVFVGFSEPVHQHLRLRIVCETHSSVYLNFSPFGSLDWRAPALRKASKLFG